ncbi:MAG: rhodanese-like domain-containing protein [Hyphomonas sp.]|uniref:rhodanese-like domain-containing protein n=1 Tax=Hyphomonas sp. TaxID=87 RepID=UPI003528B69A
MTTAQLNMIDAPNSVPVRPAQLRPDVPHAYIGGDIDVVTAAQLLATMPELKVLDVRTPVEHGEGRIRGDLNLDFYADEFADQLAGLDREAYYLIYCRCGGRSGMTISFMRDLGFRHLIHMPAGIEGWVAAGLPIQSDR